MVMDLVQVRLPKGLINDIDSEVSSGRYANRSDVIRDALRLMTLRKMVGVLPNKGDSVKEVQEIREKLARNIKSFKDVQEINTLANE